MFRDNNNELLLNTRFILAKIERLLHVVNMIRGDFDEKKRERISRIVVVTGMRLLQTAKCMSSVRTY